jgi:WD40 repeat protein
MKVNTLFDQLQSIKFTHMYTTKNFILSYLHSLTIQIGIWLDIHMFKKLNSRINLRKVWKSIFVIADLFLIKKFLLTKNQKNIYLLWSTSQNGKLIAVNWALSIKINRMHNLDCGTFDQVIVEHTNMCVS